MIRRTTILFAQIAAVLAAVLILVVGAAWWRLASGPIALPALSHHLERELSQARGGRPVTIGSTELSWSGRPAALQLRARDVRVLDARRQPLTRYREVTVGLSGLALLTGRIAVVRADFQGGEITVRRNREGGWHIAFAPPGAPPDIVVPPPPPNQTLAQRVALILNGLERALRPVGMGGSLRTVTMSGAHLEIFEDGSGGHWTARQAQVELTRQSAELQLAINAGLEAASGGQPAPASLRVTTDTAFRAAIVEFRATNARPRALFSPAALGMFAGVDAPTTANLTIGLDRRVGINRFEGDLQIGRGGAEMAGGRFALDGGRLHGRYDIDDDELVIDQIALAGTRTRIRGEIHLRNASAVLRAHPNAPAAFDVALPSLTLDVPGVFEEPFDLSRVRLVGTIQDGAMRFTQLEARQGPASLSGTGAITWGVVGTGADARTYPGFTLDARVEGPLDARALIALWPIPFVDGARDYLATALRSGQATDVVAHMAITPQDMAAHRLRNESLRITYNFQDATFRYIDTMSPLTNARGQSTLLGNSFELTLAEARVDGLNVTSGRVSIPRFNPSGDMATFTVSGEGEARALVGLLMQQPIALGPRMPLEPNTVTGRGNVTFTLQRPNRSDVPYEELRYTVDGRFENVAGVMRDSRLRMSEGRLRVRGDQREIQITGPMRLGNSNVDVQWTERLTPGIANSSRYQIAGRFDAPDLVALGYPVDQVCTGMVGVRVTGEGAGFNIQTADVALDFAQANAFLPRGFWTKRPGQAATARMTVTRTGTTGYALTNIDVRGSGLTAQGRVNLFNDGRVRDGEITRFVVDGRADMSGSMRRGPDGALEVAARGPLIDAAPFLDPDLHPLPPPATGPNAPVTRPIRFSLQNDRMELRGGAVLSNARTSMILFGPSLQTLTVDGTSPGARTFSLGLGPRAADPQGRFAFRSDDGGFAWRGITGADNIVGGVVTADGTWRMGPPSVAQFTVRVRDFRVVRVGALAQLLGSVGSLTGLVSMLNNDGIGFSTLEAPITMNPDRLNFGQSRMAGPSLGLTAAGNYDMNRDNIRVDGVVVPSYGVNSLLSNIPLLGNLIASRRGEGIIGMTYEVNGPVAAPRVGVNPLSALTPGILRRIFEPLGSRGAAAATTPPAAATGGAPARPAQVAPEPG